jgi:uroporphyrinogen decarboxylase
MTGQTAQTTLSAKENYVRAMTFGNPHHIPYEEVVHALRFDGDMMWMGEQGRDRWGVQWEYRLAEYFPLVLEHPLKSPADMDSYQPPEPLFRLKQSSLDELAPLDRDQLLVMGFHPGVLFERAWYLLGMDRLLVATITDRERVRRLLQKITDYQVAIARKYVQCDIDGVLVGDDYGTQRAMIISPDSWRALIKPEIARLVGVYRAAGKWVKFHSCGHITEIVEDLIEIGVNILNPCQAGANNLAEWGERFAGRVVFEGGMDTQYTMLLGTPEEVRAEARLRIAQLGRDPRGGLLLWADNNLPISQANRQALATAIQELGVYPLRPPERETT